MPLGDVLPPLGPRLLAAALFFSAVVLASPAPSRADETPRKPTNEIRFVVELRGTGGQVVCALFKRNQWLEKTDFPAFARIENGRAVCVFRDVPKGLYAISAFHDENGNQKLDTNFLGIPKESWCTSRNARAFMGPPDFDDAKFQYGGGKLVLHARM
jgi:uncharacterized protein (DUF2141 family)